MFKVNNKDTRMTPGVSGWEHRTDEFTTIPIVHFISLQQRNLKVFFGMVPSTSRYRADISFSILHYFLISTSNESKLIYLFITETPEGEIKTQLCIEDTALPVNYRGREATLCFLSTVRVDNLSFQSFFKKFFTPCQLSELPLKKCYQFPFVLLLL